jgi:hypothetical protein
MRRKLVFNDRLNIQHHDHKLISQKAKINKYIIFSPEHIVHMYIEVEAWIRIWFYLYKESLEHAYIRLPCIRMKTMLSASRHPSRSRS